MQTKQQDPFFNEISDDDIQRITESEALDLYNEMLDDCYPLAEVCGFQYEASRVLKEVDPIAYRVGFSDYCSSLEDDGYEIDYK